MIEFRAAAATDVGRVRSGNEDSYHRGDAVFAVADGMGGHVAGEVASRTALEPLAELDGRVFPDAHAAVEALREAVVSANAEVAERAQFEPDYRGMGTTLTATMMEGRRLHLAHVGDSRAYLLRDGVFEQLTKDHTLVQHLIDEGQITPDEAATHPQRSIITRAIGVSLELSVDTLTLEIEPGDQILLCSDGLTGVVPDDRIADVLEQEGDVDGAVERLIDMANEAGGPDNITIVLLRFAPEGGFPPTTPEEQAEPADGATDGGSGSGSTPASPAVIRSGTGTDTDGWAEKLGRLGAGWGADDEDGPRRGPSRTRRVLAVVVLLAIVLAMAAAGGRWLLSRSYYVGAADGQVAIYQGIPSTLGPIELHWVAESSDVELSDLPNFLVQDIEEGRAAASLADARTIVRNLQRMTEDDTSPDPTSSPTPDPSPSTAPTPTTTP